MNYQEIIFWAGGTAPSPEPCPHPTTSAPRPPFWNPQYATESN